MVHVFHYFYRRVNSNPVILMYVHRDGHMHFYVCFLRFQAFILMFCAASDRVMTAFCLLLCAIIGKSWLTSLH